jgi:hypothetical protein
MRKSPDHTLVLHQAGKDGGTIQFNFGKAFQIQRAQKVSAKPVNRFTSTLQFSPMFGKIV